jgi:hypothetical protein
MLGGGGINGGVILDDMVAIAIDVDLIIIGLCGF